MNIEAKYLKIPEHILFYHKSHLFTAIQSWEYSSKIENNSYLYYTLRLKSEPHFSIQLKVFLENKSERESGT